jgi:hypothetical protein
MARRFRAERIKLLTEVIGMNGNTKHLVFGLCMTIALLGAFVGGASAATVYGEAVKFKGVVTGSPDFGGAVGTGGVNVQIDEIFSDPTGNLEIEDVVTVTWYIVPPFADINAAIGDRVEVYGEYCDIEDVPDWWSDVGEHWTYLNTSDNYLKRLIKFNGTAIEYFEASMPGALWGWIVSVDEVISGPQPCSNQLNVTLQAVPPPWGYMDPNITEGDKVEVYGDYYEDQDGCGVSLVGSEDYYIIRRLMEGDVNLDKHVTITDAMYIAQYKAGLRSLSADQLKCADTTDADGVTISDAMHIAQWRVDPDGNLGILFKPLWESPADDDMLKPVR